MLNYFSRKLRFSKLINENEKKIDKPDTENKDVLIDESLSSNLKTNLDKIKEIFGESKDVVFREISFGIDGHIKAAFIYLDGMADKAVVNESIIKPLMYDSRLGITKEKRCISNIDEIKVAMISVSEVEKHHKFCEIIDGCLSGNTTMLVDGINEALVIGSRGGISRAIEESKTDTVVRGPRESFNETLRTNTSLLRRRIRNADLIFESLKIGEKTRTDVCVAYIRGIANPKLIAEVKNRLLRIKTDAILESGYIEEFIDDNPFSIFATISNSEKPDIVTAKMMEGRVAILVDNTPFVLTVPMLLVESFQSSEDYYSRPYIASFIRILRYICFFISILAPALYVAITTFQQELIPTPLLLTMSAAKEGLPFPSVLEAFIMLIIFEILREAGVRLPRPVGQAVSIVGALVLGESAVSAGLIGHIMVIIVSLTAIASFVIPAQNNSISILRIVFLLLGSTMGIFGIAMGMIGLLIHLSSLRSFGAPYLSPFAPLTLGDLKDTIIRLPIWALTNRPRVTAWNNLQRMNTNLKPITPVEEKQKEKQKSGG